MDYDYLVENVLTNTDRFLENKISGQFKAWHLIFFISAGTLLAIITLCCFIRLRLPRTKSEIVANARRRALLKNFRSKLTTLKTADLDDMDYRRGKVSRFSFYEGLSQLLCINFQKLNYQTKFVAFRCNQVHIFVYCALQLMFMNFGKLNLTFFSSSGET